MFKYALSSGETIELPYIISGDDKVVKCSKCETVNVITNFFEECYDCGHELSILDVVGFTLITEECDASCPN